MTRQGTNPDTHRPRLAAAIGALVATIIALLAASASAAVPRDFWGVAPQTPLGEADFQRMGQGKVGTLRIAVFWYTIDPTKAPGDSYWGNIDPLIAGAARNGVEILPYLYGTPKWVAQKFDRRSCPLVKCITFQPRSRKALAAWETFVGEFLDRYGATGTFWAENPDVPKNPVDVIQVLNEQNSSKFFAPKASPRGYAKILDTTADAIQAHDPGVEIVLGGMAELAGSKKAVAASEYLEQLYDIKGASKDFDGVAIHPYGASVKKVADQVELLRDVTKKARDKGAGLWVTEVGAGSASGGNPLNRGTKGQANLLTDIFKYFAKNRNKFNVKTVNWFSWMDSDVSICDWCKTSGLFKPGLKPKPSWNAFTKFTGGT